MIFSPDLCELILAGEKTVTRRPVKFIPGTLTIPVPFAPCRYLPGIDYAIQPGRGKKSLGRIRVKSVIRQEVGEITPNDARREGFSGRLGFVDRWKLLYGCWLPEVQVWRIEFELVQANQGESE
jgi:hypothetical protein